MTDMEMYLMKKIQDVELKLTKVETLLSEYSKDLDSEKDRFETLNNLLMDVKSEIGLIKGRTEKGDVNFNLEANTVDKIDASTNQNIVKDEKN